jgi:hypothetical protein
MAETTDETLADRRRRQLRASNIPEACVEMLVRKTAEPPACRADLHIGPPDFIGIGTMKSGTSWWYSLIARHPRVYRPSRRKELHFFDLLIGSPFGEAEIDEYHKLFCRPRGMLCGEWTPRYFSDFWTPAAIRRAAPDARLLVLLRDPVDRFISGVTHQLLGDTPPKISIVDMWPSHFARGLYHQHLSRYLRHFSRNQLLVLQYEKCVSDPHGELERTFRFIGLDMPETFTDDVLRTRQRTTEPAAKIRLPPHVRESLVENYREEVARLTADFPEIAPDLWRNFSTHPL